MRHGSIGIAHPTCDQSCSRIRMEAPRLSYQVLNDGLTSCRKHATSPLGLHAFPQALQRSGGKESLLTMCARAGCQVKAMDWRPAW